MKANMVRSITSTHALRRVNGKSKKKKKTFQCHSKGDFAFVCGMKWINEKKGN